MENKISEQGKALEVKSYEISGKTFRVKYASKALKELTGHTKLMETLDRGVRKNIIAENKKLDWYLANGLLGYAFIIGTIALLSLFAFAGIISELITILIVSLLSIHTFNIEIFNHKLEKNNLILESLDKMNENLTNETLVATLPKRLQKIISEQEVLFKKPYLSYNAARRKVKLEDLKQFCRLVAIVEESKGIQEISLSDNAEPTDMTRKMTTPR
ncbi:MAG: hypothetical protein PHE54_01085 [Bacilli bacterium]|nr:hypothetical protein [Bacilli bacterium]